MGYGVQLSAAGRCRWWCSVCPVVLAATWNASANAVSCARFCASAIWTASLTFAAVAILVAAAPRFSDLIFGRPDRRDNGHFAGSQPCGHHFASFPRIAVRGAAQVHDRFDDALLSKHDVRGDIACAALVLAVRRRERGHWLRRGLPRVGRGHACLEGQGLAEEAPHDAGVPHREFWPPLVRFAVWIWVTNFLCHLFAVVDRYMLVHWSGLENAEASPLSATITPAASCRCCFCRWPICWRRRDAVLEPRLGSRCSTARVRSFDPGSKSRVARDVCRRRGCAVVSPLLFRWRSTDATAKAWP